MLITDRNKTSKTHTKKTTQTKYNVHLPTLMEAITTEIDWPSREKVRFVIQFWPESLVAESHLL